MSAQITPGIKRYIAIETLIGAVICIALSVFFVWLMFRGSAQVPRMALIIDAAPQTFMIALMTSFVPTLITRARVASGTITRQDGKQFSIHNAFVRALVFAIVALVIGMPLNAAAYWFAAPEGLSLLQTYVAKGSYGAVLGAVVANSAVKAALRDEPRTRQAMK